MVQSLGDGCRASPVDYLFATDLDAAGDPAVLRDPVVGLRLATDGHREYCSLRVGIEVAVLSAVADEGLCFTRGDLTGDLTDAEMYAPPCALTPRPQPGDRITDLVTRLDSNLVHLRRNNEKSGHARRRRDRRS